eukprot:INCI17542.1.p1 GENE.INCI17542.1~~INCI17542.1.p1  ORF type:complete len:3776 (-),score=497.18 INCI17542.1:2420-13582(-)
MEGADLNFNVTEMLKGRENSVGFYPVEVSSNGQDFSTSGVLFRYHGEVGVLSLQPSHGTLYGMTEVLVTGYGFDNSSLLYCRFGTGHESVVPVVEFLSSTQIVCIAPPSLLEGTVAVQVSNNGFSDMASFSQSSALYTYDEAILPFDVIPPLGPVSGNTSTRIVGNGFLDTDGLLCRFGSLVVSAVWVDREEIRCQTPTGTDVPGYYPIEVSNNGQDFTQYGFPFYFYPDAALERITPVSGPALVAGTEVVVFGRNFVNSSYLTCRFDALMTPAIYLSDTKIVCPTPVMQYGLDWLDLSQVSNREPNPFTKSRKLYPTAHPYPFYWSKNVPVETSNNAQDFTNSGIHFLFQQDAEVTDVYPKNGRDTATTPLFVQGKGFVNSTQLTCRIGHSIVRAVFVTSELVLCFAPPQSTSEPIQGSHRRRGLRRQSFMHADQVSTYGETPSQVFVEVSNNLFDWTADWQQFEYLEPCKPGYYCPNHRAVFECPRGTFCPGTQNYNFTLCPRGTYQPHAGQANCLRCPIGYQCPYAGMPVPQICPAGFVCEVTGVEIADQPCPEGHYCHEGTATTATTCGNPEASNYLFPTMSHAERSSTIQLGRQPLGNNLVLGARNTACWSNATEDFGLQSSPYPQRFWMELHLLPLSADEAFAATRGRYCLDDSCIRAKDMDNITVSDYAFKYDAAEFALRRPVPCPSGTYCGPGTAAATVMMSNLTTPQVCQENMYCPEGAPNPRGLGECPVGFYCPLSVRLPCPVGTYCPREGHGEPLPCPPGKFNGMVAMDSCTKCPRGYICPGFGRTDPAICPAGFVCSRESMTSPNIRCPQGFYCPNGTMTSDPFRNDTTLRPYPCSPGSFCMGGVVADTIVEGDYNYPQPCAEGFHCEAGSTNAKGRGLCPKGFSCPKGTAVPVPTPVGYFAELEGVIEPAQCRPGYYTPTIQSVQCYDCPPGTQCQNDGDSVATVCPPGTYRSEQDKDGTMCTGCPQGTFSKNWETRSALECNSCPTGVVCPIDGMSSPCSLMDVPKPWTPTDQPYSISQCLLLGDDYRYGHLDPTRPWAIDSKGRGPFMVESVDGQCFFNDQPNGTIVYQRLRDYFGSMYHLERGHDHQGYGTDEYQGEFGFGSRYIDLREGSYFAPPFACIPGMRLLNYSRGGNLKDQWYPGTCEADIMCNFDARTEMTPCTEGYYCYERTTSLTAVDHICKAGYVCGFGSTPDVTLNAPSGQYKQLCPAGYYCPEGTGVGQQFQYPCPENYFCPSGTADPWLGILADDSFHRVLNATMADPFLYMSNTGIPGGLPEIFTSPESVADRTSRRRRRRLNQDQYLGGGEPIWPNDDIYDDPSVVDYVKLPGERVEQLVSSHDQRCFNGINETKQASHEERINLTMVDIYPNLGFYRQNLAIENDQVCARDHKWKSVYHAISRGVCDCKTQFRVVRQVYDFWRCTHPDSPDSLSDCTFQLDYESNETSQLIEQTCEWDGTLQNITSCSSSECAINGDCESNKARVRIAWTAMGYYNNFEELMNYATQEHAKEYDEKRYEDREAIDPFVYDLNYATTQVYRLRGEIKDWFYMYDCSPSAEPRQQWQYDTLNPFYYKETCQQHEGEPVRLDMCSCQSNLRCPNGTLSTLGQQIIYDCLTYSAIEGGDAYDDVLMRKPVFESVSTQGLTNASGLDASEYGIEQIYVGGDWNWFDENPITGTHEGLGYLQLRGWDVVTLTMDMRKIHVNLTYGTHYRIAVYPDCTPCPQRYLCDGPALRWDAEQAQTGVDSLPYEDDDDNPENDYCSFPPLVDQRKQIFDPELYNVSTRDFEPGCEEREGRNINGMIYQGCGATRLSAAEAPEGFPVMPAMPAGAGIFCDDCCSCQPHEMPYFFEDTSHDDEYFPQFDNKHVMLQISIGTVKDVNVTVALELLHGNFLSEFQAISADQFDATFFSPSRADFVPESQWLKNHELGAYSTFLAYVTKDLYEDRMSLPLNFPTTTHPILGTTVMEDAIFVDRIADILIGDPSYVLRQRCRHINSAFKVDESARCGFSVDSDASMCDSFVDIQGREFRFDEEYYYWHGDYAGFDSGPTIEWEYEYPEYQQLHSICQNQAERNNLTWCEGDNICASPADYSPNTIACDGPFDLRDVCSETYSVYFENLEEAAANYLSSESTSRTPGDPPSIALGAWLDDDPLVTDGSGLYFDRGHLLTVNTPLTRSKLNINWFEEGGELSSEVSFLTLPYLPYFSNCEGYGRHVYIAKLLEEHSDCSRPSLVDTQYTDYIDFMQMFDPKVQNTIMDYTDACGEADPSVFEPGGEYEDDADPDETNWLEDAKTNSHYKGIELKCRYEESLVSVDPNPRWYEMANGEEIFYLTKYPVPYRKIAGSTYPDYSPGLGGVRSYRFPRDPVSSAADFFISETLDDGSTATAHEATRGNAAWCTDVMEANGECVQIPDDMECFFCAENGQLWGRPDELEVLSEPANIDSLIKVRPGGGDFAGSDGDEESQVTFVPRHITLQINYYQEAKGLKRLVDAWIEFEDMCTYSPRNDEVQNVFIPEFGVYPCNATGDDEDRYTLEVKFIAMKYGDLLNAFEFPLGVYLVLFVVVSFFTTLVGMIFYFFHRLITRIKNPPKFRFGSLLCVVVPSPFIGCFFALVPHVIGWSVIYFQFAQFPEDYDPTTELSDWQLDFTAGVYSEIEEYETAPTMEAIKSYREGRVGYAHFVLGVYMLVFCAVVMIPNYFDEKWRDDIRRADQMEAEGVKVSTERMTLDEEEEKKKLQVQSLYWAPLVWKRSHIVVYSLLVTIATLPLIEFSFSGAFEDNVITIIILLKLLMVGVDIGLEKIFREHLLIAPCVILLNSTLMLVTLGASNLEDFIFSYTVELLIALAERLYVGPFTKKAVARIPRFKLQCRRRFQKRRRLTRAQRQEQDAEWKAVNEDIKLQEEGVEPMLESYLIYALETASLLLCPFLVCHVAMFYEYTEMGLSYGIKKIHLIYYVAFQFIVIPGTLFMDMFTLNAIELFHSWKLYDYVHYQKYRFSVREHRWILRSQVVDESISQPLQSVDLMCFSPQFYFVATLAATALIEILLGLQTLIRKQFNMFADPMFVVVCVETVILGIVIRWILVGLANLVRLWKLRTTEGTVDDDIAEKLAIGESNQEDLEMARLELQALNSERFRHRFLERSRPWILQHLEELLTPRTLANIGADGRPNVDYIRDVYADLMNMGRQMAREGDAAGITPPDSDEDAMEDARRKWPRTPLTGPSLAIAKYWLNLARQRRTCLKLVRGYLQRMTKAQCDLCGRKQSAGAIMSCSIVHPDTGEVDDMYLNELIKQFNEKTEGKPFDENLWKAFFRETAKLITRCDRCVDQVEQAKIEARRRRLAQESDKRVTRAGDIEDDDEADGYGPVFEALVVPRSSPEGRIMSKWLTAARKRMGGDFPRPEARKLMEDYKRRMHDRKMRSTLNPKTDTLRIKGAPKGRPPPLSLSEATKALAKLWLQKGRASLKGRLQAKAKDLYEEIDRAVAKMPEKDDWFYTSELRLAGENLANVGRSLREERRNKQAQADGKSRKMQDDVQAYRDKKEAEMAEELAEFEKHEQSERAKLERELEKRKIDVLAHKATRQQEFEESSKKLSEFRLKEAKAKFEKDMTAVDASIVAERQKLLQKFESGIAAQREAILKKHENARQAILRKSNDALNKARHNEQAQLDAVKKREEEWRKQALVWLNTANKKFAKKAEADAEHEAQKKSSRRRK